MKQMINIREMNTEQALQFALLEYQTECMSVSGLIQTDFSTQLREIIENIKECRYGKALIQDGELLGYLGFYGPWDGFFGLCKGVFSPLGAHAFGGSDVGKTASLLLAAVAEDMVKDNIYSIALSHYAHQEEVMKSFILNGFGIRCSDAILKVSDYPLTEHSRKPSFPVSIEELKGEEKIQIKDLFLALIEHLRKAPCFFPTDPSCVNAWFANEEKRVFAAKKDGDFIGYMAICDDGETFVTEHESMYNICGAYVKPEYRQSGVANILLEELVKVCIQEGKSYLGVDCETLNPTALRFWRKNFESYTYSLHRRIDERIGY